MVMFVGVFKKTKILQGRKGTLDKDFPRSGKQLNQTRQWRNICDQPHAVTNMFQTQEPEGQQETRLPFPSMESHLYKSTLGPALLGPPHVLLPTTT